MRMRLLARSGFLKQDEVREVEKEVLVDTGATMLTLKKGGGGGRCRGKGKGCEKVL